MFTEAQWVAASASKRFTFSSWILLLGTGRALHSYKNFFMPTRVLISEPYTSSREKLWNLSSATKPPICFRKKEKEAYFISPSLKFDHLVHEKHFSTHNSGMNNVYVQTSGIYMCINILYSGWWWAGNV